MTASVRSGKRDSICQYSAQWTAQRSNASCLIIIPLYHATRVYHQTDYDLYIDDRKRKEWQAR